MSYIKPLFLILALLPSLLFSQFEEEHVIHERGFTPSTGVRAVGDINGDGYDDILVSTSIIDSDLVAYFGSAQGLSTEPQDALLDVYGHIRLAPDPLIDIDLDGDLDLLLSPNGAAVTTSWWENDGLGYFTVEHLIVDARRELKAADLDNDGDIDFYTADDEDIDYYGVGWYEQITPDQFEEHTLLVTGVGLNLDRVFINAGDLDGDGLLDLVFQEHDVLLQVPDSISIYETKSIQWLRNLGSGQFADAELLQYGGASNSGGASQLLDLTASDTLYLVFGPDLFEDFDGDGDLDRISIGSGGDLWQSQSGFEIRLLNESGNYGQAQDLWINEFRQVSGHPLRGDFDGDGDLDCVFSSISDMTIVVWYNQGNYTYEEEVLVRPEYLEGHHDFVEDLDDDGDNDILFFSRDQQVLKFYNDGAGTFTAPDSITTIDHATVHDIVYEDLDQDGHKDLVMAYRESIAVRYADGDGGFLDEELLLNELDTLSQLISYLYILDVDADGDQDIIYDFQYGIFSHSMYLALNDGEQSFGIPQMVQEGTTYDYQASWGDINDDGLPDFVARVQDSQSVVIELNLGGGQFDQTVLYDLSSGNYHNYPTLGDIDMDGDLDIVFPNPQPGNLLKCFSAENLGNGDFSEPQPFVNIGEATAGIQFLDIDGDGVLDAHSGRKYALGIGNGEFSSALSFPTNYPLFMANMDGDNLPDLIDLKVLDMRWYGNDLDEFSYAQGHVFVDTIANEEFDLVEPGHGLVSLEFGPGGFIQYISSATPTYSVPMSNGNYNVYPSYNEDLWELVVPYSHYVFELSIDEPVAAGLDFGFVPIGEQELGEIDLNSANTGCDNSSLFTWNYVNTGNTYTSGAVVVSIDPLLSLLSSAQADSIVGQNAYFSFDSLIYGEGLHMDLSVLNPDFQFMGEEVCNTVEVFNSEGISISTDTLCYILTCAYDPNDKQEHTGLTEAGYISGDDPLEYTIRFQNTGNDYAETVIIRDALSGNLLKNTLEVTGWSHDYELHIDEGNVAHFTFDNILLPDSTADFIGSQGFISFRIMPEVDLPGGTVITNAANIFFDSNPPVLTNTVQNTIFDCEAPIQIIVDELLCEGSQTEISTDAIWLEDYTWYIDSVQLSTDETLVWEVQNAEQIQLIASNPLCPQYSLIQDVNTLTSPIVEIVMNDVGDLELVSTTVGEFQWYQDGVPIAGAISFAYTPLAGYAYTVSVTDEFACSGISEPFIVSGLADTNLKPQLKAYPNPAETAMFLELVHVPAADYYYELRDVYGAIHRHGLVRDGITAIQLEDLAQGYYLLSVTSENAQTKLVRKVIHY